MLVEVWGPNLPQSRHGETFHVHTPDCADTKRGIYRYVRRFGDKPWTIDVDNTSQIVQAIYPPDDFDYDPDGPEFAIYDQDVYIFPCVGL